MFVEPLRSQFKHSVFSFFFATTNQVVIITFTFQRRKLRFRDVKQYTHFIYQVMEITGFDGSRAYWNWVHFTCGTMDSAWE